MALDPSSRYPAQIATDAGYPHGKAQNCAVAGDGTGTPLEADLLNDLFGLEQGLLAAAGITPSGTPDTGALSQYVLAIRYIATHALGPVYAGYGFSAQDVQAFGNLSIGGSSLFVGIATFDASALFANGLTVSAGLTSINGTAVFNGTTGFNGAVGLNGAVTLGSTSSVSAQSEIVLSGAGRIRKRVVYAANADTTYDVTQTDIVIIKGDGSITGSHTYSIAATGASDGSEIEFRNFDGTHAHHIKPSGGTTVDVPVANAGAGFGAANKPSLLRAAYGNGNGTGSKWELTEIVTA